jgi:hypothetical protein
VLGERLQHRPLGRTLGRVVAVVLALAQAGGITRALMRARVSTSATDEEVMGRRYPDWWG